MLFNPVDFIARKADVIKHFTKVGVTEDTVTDYCPLAMIPISVVCTFIMEEMDEHREFCERKIREVEEFYGG